MSFASPELNIVSGTVSSNRIIPLTPDVRTTGGEKEKKNTEWPHIHSLNKIRRGLGDLFNRFLLSLRPHYAIEGNRVTWGAFNWLKVGRQ